MSEDVLCRLDLGVEFRLDEVLRVLLGLALLLEPRLVLGVELLGLTKTSSSATSSSNVKQSFKSSEFLELRLDLRGLRLRLLRPEPMLLAVDSL